MNEQRGSDIDNHYEEGLMEEQKVVSFEELKESQTAIIPIPNAKNDGTIYVRAKRVALSTLVQSGGIPNELLKAVFGVLGDAKKEGKLIDAGIGADDDEKAVEQWKSFARVLDVVARQALVEPTYEQFEEAGGLTTEQLTALYMWVQQGFEAVSGFCRHIVGNPGKGTQAVGSGGRYMGEGTE